MQSRENQKYYLFRLFSMSKKYFHGFLLIKIWKKLNIKQTFFSIHIFYILRKKEMQK